MQVTGQFVLLMCFLQSVRTYCTQHRVRYCELWNSRDNFWKPIANTITTKQYFTYRQQSPRSKVPLGLFCDSIILALPQLRNLVDSTQGRRAD